MIFTGVLERYPRLHVGTVERTQLGAAFPGAPRLHVHATRQARLVVPLSLDNMLPSDFFHRSVFLSFQEDPLGLKTAR